MPRTPNIVAGGRSHKEELMTSLDHTPHIVRLGNLTIDLDGHVIERADGSTDILTQQEQELLCVLIREEGRVLSYADLAVQAWQYPAHYYSVSGIRNCVWRLRRKIGDSAIQTVRHVGYRFCRPTATGR
jgi:DNA-binding response OmpR family regulator